MVRRRNGKLRAEDLLHLQPEIDGLEAFGRRHNISPADNVSFADWLFQMTPCASPIGRAFSANDRAAGTSFP